MNDRELRRLERVVDLGRAVRAARESLDQYQQLAERRTQQLREQLAAAEEAFEKASDQKCAQEAA